MKKDKNGTPLKVGDMIQIDMEYGGGLWQIIEMSPSSNFIVVMNKAKQRRSFSAGDGVKSNKPPYFDEW